jgi:hypothetical protein
MTEASRAGQPPPTGALRPDWATRLGQAGLLPFIAGALLVWLVHDELRPYTEHALAIYAAVIVSFLGGIHWGVALRQARPDPRLLAWGVAPSLLAWVAAMMPPSAGLALLGAALVAGYLVDRRLYPAHGLQGWLTLRFRLTAVASLCCFLGAAGS